MNTNYLITHSVGAAVISLVAASGCMSDRQVDTPGQGRFELRAAALELEGVTNARWRITVENGATPREVVWTRELDADRFGDGQGAITYVGPCDAGEGVTDNLVTVELLTLFEGEPPVAADTASWRNPGPLSREVTCLENRDVAVVFELTLMRQANQGFFDIAVNLDDVFCSAKLDCQPELLNYPANDPQGRTGRGPTAVIAFACTAGQTPDGAARPSYLYLDAARLVCPGEDEVLVRPLPMNPGGGNLGAVPPAFFQTAVYVGKEAFPDLNKCYWNMALGLEPAVDGCSLQVTGTASSTPLPNGTTPDQAAYPVLTWDVPLSGTSCTQNPLDGPNSGVKTDYLRDTSKAFAYELSCGDEPDIKTFGNICNLQNPGVRFTEVQGSVTVEQSGVTPFSASLPQGYKLAGDNEPNSCCTDPCCGP